MKEGAFGRSNMQPEGIQKSEQSKHEQKDGLPVISSEEYERQYKTDIRAMGDHGTATFNFQGFIREAREGYDHGVFYMDAMATNGLLKEKGHEGIHVGTDGIKGYSSKGNHEMKSPKDIGEYDLYIRIPGELQKKKGVFCTGDSCLHTEGGNIDSMYRPEDIEGAQKTYGYIVRRFSFNPKEDSHAREKAQFIHHAVVRHIEADKPLWEIGDLINELVERLEDMTPEEMEKVENSLERQTPKKLGE